MENRHARADTDGSRLRGVRPGAATRPVRRHRRRRLAEDRGVGRLQRGLPGVRAFRRRREHVGPARRVPLRLEAHDGRLHPAGARGVPRARASIRIERPAGWCGPTRTPTPRTSMASCTATASPRSSSGAPKGAVTAQTELAVKGARRHPARTQGRRLHLLGGASTESRSPRRRSRTSTSATTCWSAWRCARTTPT